MHHQTQPQMVLDKNGKHDKIINSDSQRINNHYFKQFCQTHTVLNVMNKIHHIMLGVGSIFVIMPSQQPEDYSRFIITETDEERMEYVWEQVGKDIKTATEQFTHEHNYTLKSGR